MFETKVGYSVEKDSLKSGVETATKASEGVKPKLGLMFTSCVQDQQKIMEGAKSVLKDVPILGCTSSAAIVVSDAGYLGPETGYSGMMTFSGDDLLVGVAASERNEEPREIGKRLAREAIKNAGINRVPSYFFMTASPKEEEEYLKGIQDVIGRVPMFGGSAADNTVEGKWSIFCNDKIFNDGCAVAFFFAKNECKTEYTGAYQETNHVGIITKVRDKRTLEEIDNVRALEKYAEWTGKPIDKLKGNNLLTETIHNPLGVKDVLGDVTAIRHPMFGNDDLSMNIGANLEEKTAIIHMTATTDDLIHSNSQTVKALNKRMKREVAGYLLVHCGGRRLGIALDGREREIYDDVRLATGDKPFLMVFTFGEYGYRNHSANTVGGLSLSFTAFSK